MGIYMIFKDNKGAIIKSVDGEHAINALKEHTKQEGFDFIHELDRETAKVIQELKLEDFANEAGTKSPAIFFVFTEIGQGLFLAPDKKIAEIVAIHEHDLGKVLYSFELTKSFVKCIQSQPLTNYRTEKELGREED